MTASSTADPSGPISLAQAFTLSTSFAARWLTTLPRNGASRNEAQWDVMLFCHLTDLIALFSLSIPSFCLALITSFLPSFFSPLCSLPFPPFTENLILMQQTIETAAKLFQTNLTSLKEQLGHLTSQVSAANLPLSHIYNFYYKLQTRKHSYPSLGLRSQTVMSSHLGCHSSEAPLLSE